MTIKNDQEFKKVLAELSISQQRELGVQFVNSVLSLNSDPLIVRTLDTVQKQNEGEYNDLYAALKSLAVKTYTTCGNEADWMAQAAHFVVSAAKICVTPEEQLKKNNLAWQCAMQTRMANNCAMMERDNEELDNEAQKQYVIADEFI